MDTNVHEDEKLLFRKKVFQTVGCAIEVLNTLDHGLLEKPYENALVVEFRLRQIPFRQPPAFDVLYKNQRVGTFVPDLIAFDSIIVDTKVIDRITDQRTRFNVELSANHQATCRAHSEFQRRSHEKRDKAGCKPSLDRL